MKLKNLTIKKVIKELFWQALVLAAFTQTNQSIIDVITWLYWVLGVLVILAAITLSIKPELREDEWSNRFWQFELITGLILCCQFVYFGYAGLATVYFIAHLFAVAVYKQKNHKNERNL